MNKSNARIVGYGWMTSMRRKILSGDSGMDEGKVNFVEIVNDF